ncbi:MAG: hypothetical protein M3P31_05620 [Actinomycetota bacterium]|nr:hypothetical protein [Actinomycetota bacterium]
MIVSSYHYLVGPLVAAGALGVILLICRWVFSTTHRDDRTARRLEKARARGDYGLLVPVTRVRTRDDAEMLRSVLQEAHIRCTVGEAGDDAPGLAVLVFRADAERARDLVASRP